MYEFIILAHLMPGSSYGYRIAKIINDMSGPYVRVSNGSLYPLFAKLEQQGLIVGETRPSAQQPGDRKLRIYSITEKGRLRFHALMMDTTSHQRGYQEIFLQKTGFFAFISLEECLRLIDHYIHYCQGHILYQQSEIEDLLQIAGDDEGSVWKKEDMVNAMRHTLAQWQLELEWAKSLRERVMRAAEKEEVS